MTTATLFGVALAPLFAAIAQVESDNGATSDNVYQLQSLYVHDCNRIVVERLRRAPLRTYAESDRFDRVQSERMIREYLEHYGERYRRLTGKTPTAEVLARIHNGGPNGWRKEATAVYWEKVKAAMERSERK